LPGGFRVYGIRSRSQIHRSHVVASWRAHLFGPSATKFLSDDGSDSRCREVSTSRMESISINGIVRMRLRLFESTCAASESIVIRAWRDMAEGFHKLAVNAAVLHRDLRVLAAGEAI